MGASLTYCHRPFWARHSGINLSSETASGIDAELELPCRFGVEFGSTRQIAAKTSQKHLKTYLWPNYLQSGGLYHSIRGLAPRTVGS